MVTGFIRNNAIFPLLISLFAINIIRMQIRLTALVLMVLSFSWTNKWHSLISAGVYTISPSAKYENILTAWETHNHMTHLLIEGISNTENLQDTSCSGGRTVGEQLSHMHNVRVQWLNSMGIKRDEILEMNESTYTKNNLIEAFQESTQAISDLIRLHSDKDLLPGYQGSTLQFVTYLVSHESHHRGQIILSLKQSGHPIDPEISYGIWNWENK